MSGTIFAQSTAPPHPRAPTHRLPPAPGTVLVLAEDPHIIAATLAAAASTGRPPAQLLRTGAEALARLAAPGRGPAHLVCDPSLAGATWPALLAMVSERGSPTRLILVAQPPGPVPMHICTRPQDLGQLKDALALPRAPQASPNPATAQALRDGIARGEIAVRYQPVVRLADGRPAMVEALARWLRPAAEVPPDDFVPLAEAAGLARALSAAVLATAMAELGPLWPRLRLGVSINLPLALLLAPDLPAWLHRATARGALAPAQVSIELTETTPVQDLARLQVALRRLAAAGIRVLLDDVTLDDGRSRLHALAFAGLKLDRSLVERLPTDAHARNAVRRLVRHATARGQAVIAEGVSDRRLWAAARGAGVHYAQGYAVGRPLPAAALPAWAAAWRADRRPL